MASAISGSARDTRLIREGEVITKDLPTSRCRVCGSGDSWPWLADGTCAGVAAVVAGSGAVARAESSARPADALKHNAPRRIILDNRCLLVMYSCPDMVCVSAAQSDSSW